MEITMHHIQKTSSYLVSLFKFLLICLPLYIFIQWIFIHLDFGMWSFLNQNIETPEGFVKLSKIQWTPILQFLGCVSEFIGRLPFFVSLWFLIGIFQNYKKGKIFNYENALLYRKIGWVCFFDALFIKSLSKTLLILTVTFTNPPGHRYITISFGTPNLTAIFYGMIVIVISWVMLEACKISEENELIV